MVYKIGYKSSVERDLKRISKNEARKIIDEIDKTLTENPKLFPQLKGEFKGLRKFRIGNYRVIFTIESEEITIFKIGHRKDVYK